MTALRSDAPALSRVGARRLPSPRPTLLVALSTLFVVLTALVWTNISWVTATDLTVAQRVAQAHSETLNKVMFGITLLGNRLVIGALLAALTVWVVGTGRCRTPLAVMIGAFLFNPALEAALKGLVGRDRPDIARLVNGSGPAFPSGHVLATVGFYGVLAVVVWRSTTSRSLAVGSLAGAGVVIALVGFSRIYLGVHWLTDVVGGLLIGTVFVLVVSLIGRRHHLGGADRCAHRPGGEDQRTRVPSRRDR